MKSTLELLREAGNRLRSQSDFHVFALYFGPHQGRVEFAIYLESASLRDDFEEWLRVQIDSPAEDKRQLEMVA